MANRNLTPCAVLVAALYVLTSGAFAYAVCSLLQGGWQSAFVIASVPMIALGAFFVATSARLANE